MHGSEPLGLMIFFHLNTEQFRLVGSLKHQTNDSSSKRAFIDSSVVGTALETGKSATLSDGYLPFLLQFGIQIIRDPKMKLCRWCEQASLIVCKLFLAQRENRNPLPPHLLKTHYRFASWDFDSAGHSSFLCDHTLSLITEMFWLQFRYLRTW